MHTPSPLDEREQIGRLRVFLRSLIPLAGFFGALELVAWRVFDDPQSLWAGVVIWAYAAVASAALWRLRRGRLNEAALSTSVGILFASILIAVIQPAIYPALIVATLMAIGIALPYLHGRALAASLAAAWLAAIEIVTLATLRPIPSILPAWFLAAFNIAAVSASTGLALILLWQFRSRLTNALLDARRANDDLHLAQAERLLTERRLAAAERHESLGILAGGIAHDFNNLLTTVIGHADLLRGDLPRPVPPAVDESLTAIQTAARHAADLSRQMLAYSGRTTTSLTRLDPVDVVRTLVDDLRPGMAVGISLEVAVSASVGLIEADDEQLRQALVNLVRNAVEAMTGESRPDDAVGSITITVGECVLEDPADLGPGALAPEPIAAGRYVTIAVSDTGPGVAPDIAGRMFEPFATSRFVGRGLGLSVVLGMVRSHSGSVTVASGPDHGTTVTILLPAVV